MPFTLRNLKEDLEDLGSRFDGAPDLEFRSATEGLEILAATSPWYDLPDHLVDRALERLGADLRSGEWHRRYADLPGRPELDVGPRLITTASAGRAPG